MIRRGLELRIKMASGARWIVTRSYQFYSNCINTVGRGIEHGNVRAKTRAVAAVARRRLSQGLGRIATLLKLNCIQIVNVILSCELEDGLWNKR